MKEKDEKAKPCEVEDVKKEMKKTMRQENAKVEKENKKEIEEVKEKIEQKKRKKEKDKKKDENIKWFIEVFVMTFILSMVFSYISTNGVSNLSLIPAILILVAVITVGIIFDIVGVAVTVANENEFHAKATKKVKGSKDSIKLIRNAPRVANICADVIGDICGVLSGAISALIAVKITDQFGLSFDLQFLLSALVSAITVGGKALGKNIANSQSTKIVHAVGMAFNKFNLKELNLSVFSDNERAIHCYKKLGFKDVKIDKNIITRDGKSINDIYMNLKN